MYHFDLLSENKSSPLVYTVTPQIMYFADKGNKERLQRFDDEDTEDAIWSTHWGQINYSREISGNFYFKIRTFFSGVLKDRT